MELGESAGSPPIGKTCAKRRFGKQDGAVIISGAHDPLPAALNWSRGYQADRIRRQTSGMDNRANRAGPRKSGNWASILRADLPGVGLMIPTFANK